MEGVGVDSVQSLQWMHLLKDLNRVGKQLRRFGMKRINHLKRIDMKNDLKYAGIEELNPEELLNVSGGDAEGIAKGAGQVAGYVIGYCFFGAAVAAAIILDKVLDKI